MNHHTKAQIAVRRELADMAAQWIKQRERVSSPWTRPAELEAMRKLEEELRTQASNLETAEPNPRNRSLRARSERMKDLIGRKVRLLRTIRTRGGRDFPAGTVMTIEGHWRGEVHLSSGMWYPADGGAPFPHTEEEEHKKRGNPGGTSGYVRRVAMDGLELLPKDGA